MKKHFPPLLAFSILALAMLACSVSSVGGNPEPSQDDVSTAVALTFQALTPDSNGDCNTGAR